MAKGKTEETVGDMLKGMSAKEIEDIKAFYGILFGEDFPNLDSPLDEPAFPAKSD